MMSITVRSKTALMRMVSQGKKEVDPGKLRMMMMIRSRKGKEVVPDSRRTWIRLKKLKLGRINCKGKMMRIQARRPSKSRNLQSAKVVLILPPNSIPRATMATAAKMRSVWQKAHSTQMIRNPRKREVVDTSQFSKMRSQSIGRSVNPNKEVSSPAAIARNRFTSTADSASTAEP